MIVEKPNILIAVPAYGGSVTSGFFRSFVAMTVALMKAGIGFTLVDADINDIAMARNYFASLALEQCKTHLLCIDNDMTYGPNIIFRMIESNTPIIGCVAAARSTALSVNVRNRGKPAFANGIAKVDAIGAGILLVQTAALATMTTRSDIRKEFPHVFADKGLTGPLYGFFDRLPRSNGGLTGEDLSFCERAAQCDIPVHALCDENVGHIGTITHNAPAPKMFDDLPAGLYSDR